MRRRLSWRVCDAEAWPRATGAAQFGFSSNGTMAYIAGGVVRVGRRLTLFDLSGGVKVLDLCRDSLVAHGSRPTDSRSPCAAVTATSGSMT